MSSLLRFAPSPTGLLHIGNARTALVNWLFARRHGGGLILRIDDTDAERSSRAFEAAIIADLVWLGIDWQTALRQSERGAVYESAFARLEAKGRIYPAYETAEELAAKREAQRARGLPPRYDRAALALTSAERAAFEAEGRTPHWRFRLSGLPVHWRDLVQGEAAISTDSLSDPVLRKADGGWTYTMASVVDDAWLGISHVIRGDDHRTNTAVQIELLRALDAELPDFAHLPLLTGPGGAPLSKRSGDRSLMDYRARGIEPHALRLVLASLGTDRAASPETGLDELIESFDLGRFGRSSAVFDEEQLGRVSALVFQGLDVETARKRPGLARLTAAEWALLRENVSDAQALRHWLRILHEPIMPIVEDAPFLAVAASLLPEALDGAESAAGWLDAVKQATRRRGRALFHPLRLALTGRDDGPKLADLLPLLGRERIARRLAGDAA